MGIAKEKLTDAQREQIARRLFTVCDNNQPQQNGEIHGLCPIHNEKKPSFSYNYHKDVFNCLSCGATGDLVDLFGSVNHITDKAAAFKAFCSEHGIETRGKNSRTPAPAAAAAPAPPSKSQRPKGATPQEAFDLMPPLTERWHQRLHDLFGWDPGVMEALELRKQSHYHCKHTGQLKPLRKIERFAIPIKDPAGAVQNLRLYKPGAKDMKIISFGKGYGSSRLFPATPKPDGIILLCEGEKDTITALSHGFNAITQTGKLVNWPEDHRAPFQGREVVIAYDADQVGEKYAKQAAQTLTDTAAGIRLLEWPATMGRQPDGTWPHKKGQDLTDYFTKHKGTHAGLQKLIDAALPLETDQEEDDHEAPDLFFDQGINGRVSFRPRLLAEHLLEELELLNDPMTGLMYRWNSKWWDRYEEDHVRKECLNHLGKEAQRSRAEDAFYQIKVLATLPHGCKPNERHEWACLQNGMLNLKEMQFMPHEKDYYSTMALGVTYEPNSNKRCDRWLRFLKETIQTPDAIAQAQEFAGYCLTRETRFAKCLLLVGPGSDGKSTFLKILQKLVGEENCSSVAFQDLEKEFQRACLYGKLLNVATEVSTQKALESPMFKAIVTGDTINASFKHHDAFDFTPFCKLAFATNKLPKILDNSDGLFRRLLPIRFKRQFLEDDADPYLEETLEGELSQIFEWALVGLHRLWKQHGFTKSRETEELLMEYRLLNNPVLCFVDDQCLLDDELSTTKEDLYSTYEQYCKDHGYHKMNDRNFFRELYAAQSAIKPYRQRVGKERVQRVKGIGIVTTDIGGSE